MAMDDMDVRRTRMEMVQVLRRVNRETIQDLVPNLAVHQLKPFFKLVANARGNYIKRLVGLANGNEGVPTDEQMNELIQLRRTYDELIHGAQMIETAIERGYIDTAADQAASSG